MKSFVKYLVLLPFVLLDKVTFNGESILWRCANSVISDDAKFRLSKHVVFGLVARKNSHTGFKINTYLNALNFKSEIADRFANKLIANLPNFESQLGQDCFVDTLFGEKNEGVFVEVGVGDGKNISNTYFLEKHRNWTGLLCEPATKFQDSIRAYRRAALVTDAVYNETGLEVAFTEYVGNEELSTLAAQNVPDSHGQMDTRTYPVKTISFNDLYEQYLKDKRIDYLSLDTEGSELIILKSINLEGIDISIISVEHNYDEIKLDQVTQLLERFGYVEVLQGVFEFDAMFVKRNLIESL